MTTELFLIRHGEPQLKKALLGLTDSPLSEQGWQQMATNCAKLTDIDLVITSPLPRCLLFAEHFARQEKRELLVEPDFQESDFGDWDGQLYQDLHEQFPQTMHNFFIDPANNPPPNGESLQQFSMRIEMALLRLLQEHEGKRIALFIHSGVIRTFIAWCLQMDYLKAVQFQRISLDYGSISQISVYAHEGEHFPQLRYINQIEPRN